MTRLLTWPVPDDRGVDAFGDPVWQMSYGERIALVGLLHTLRPTLAIEIGSREGGSLIAAAAYSDEVHSFDLDPPTMDGAASPNVHLHTGDSHRLLAPALAAFAAEGRTVDYALVDGDHSADGVRRDIEDLLASPAVSRTVIVLHDTANEVVRSGCDAVDYDAYDKVCHVDLDVVPGALGDEAFSGQLWGGLGFIIVDARAGRSAGRTASSHRHHHAGRLLRIARAALEIAGPLDGPPDSERVIDTLSGLRDDVRRLEETVSLRDTEIRRLRAELGLRPSNEGSTADRVVRPAVLRRMIRRARRTRSTR